MKTRILQILGVAAIATLGMVSCDTDACKDVTCDNGGSCVEGTCECLNGYEGTNCETLVRAKFLGTANFEEVCDSTTVTFAIVSGAGASDTDVVFTNLYDANLVTNGTVNADGGITIASQDFGTANIAGSATESAGIITIDYVVTANGVADNCTATSQP